MNCKKKMMQFSTFMDFYNDISQEVKVLYDICACKMKLVDYLFNQ